MRRSTAPRWVMPLLILLAFWGAGIMMTLTSFHMAQSGVSGKLFQLACGQQDGGCAEVLNSDWAFLPGGRPLASLGFVYFAGLGLWYLVVGSANRRGRFWQALPLVIQITGALVSLFFLIVMLTQLDAICWLCTLSHFINFALLLLAWKAWPRDSSENELPRPAVRLAVAGMVVVAALCALTVQQLTLSEAQAASDNAKAYAKTFHDDLDLQRYLFLRQPVQAIKMRPDDPVRGNLTAPHTVVIFSDFQCPPCRDFAEFSERELLPRFGNRLKIVYRYFPWETDCNPWSDQVYHLQACEAAFAAEAAREIGGNNAFWRMHDVLFANQANLPKASWDELGRQAGLDGAAVAQRIARHSSAARIRQDADAGNALQLQFTPTLYLDGRPVSDWGRLDLWEALVGEGVK
jgi:protein-disulfide isomerase/uncharacterized membrane protein